MPELSVNRTIPAATLDARLASSVGFSVARTGAGSGVSASLATTIALQGGVTLPAPTLAATLRAPATLARSAETPPPSASPSLAARVAFAGPAVLEPPALAARLHAARFYAAATARPPAATATPRPGEATNATLAWDQAANSGWIPAL